MSKAVQRHGATAGAASTRPAGLDAVVLIARDFKGQVAFYRDVLGLEPVSQSADAAFFRCGGQKLAIFAKSHHP